MPISSGRTEWASKIVILLQLAAWCAVGITLIQKGMTSLRDKSTMTTQEPSVRETSLKLSSVSFQRETLNNDDTQRDVWDMENWKAEQGQNVLHEREPRNPVGEKESTKLDAYLSVLQNKDEKLERNSIKKRTNKAIFSDDEVLNEMIKIEESTTELTKSSQTYPDEQNKDSVAFEQSRTMISENEEYPARVSSFDTTADEADAALARKNNKVVGGAAIAVAMLSVGAIMLLLGPAVVILRALDERRQRRRFLKLATTHDLPPSYEQATLMDEAPRYSTLRLNNT